MEKVDLKEADSDSGKGTTEDGISRHQPLDHIPDPDDELSTQERAKIVPTPARLPSFMR